MGLGSILLGVFALVFMFAGFLFTFVPFLGTMLSFIAPVLAVAGIVLGGVALSRARESGESEGLAIGGLVVNIVAFVPAMLVAVTCGVCNTLCTGLVLTPPTDPSGRPWYQRDAGPSPFDVLLGSDAGVLHAPPNAPPPAIPPPSLAPPTPTAPPTPIAPTPIAPTPIAPTPIAPTPIAPTPIAPSPSTPPAAASDTPATLPPPPLPPGPR